MQGQRKKRHHHVPRKYLERFASGGNVEVVRRDGKSFASDPINVAVEAGFYDISGPDGARSQIVEDLFEAVEGAAHAALAEIDRTGRPPAPGSEGRARLSWFLALQMSRTTQQREQVLFPRRVVEWADGRSVTKELVAEYLETEHLGFRPRDEEADGAWVYVTEYLKDESAATPESAIETMFAVAAVKAPEIDAMSWTVEADRRRRFITSDAPVIPWRRHSERDHFEGIGFDRAEELRFPLDPGKQLVVSHRKRRPAMDVGAHRVRRANADIASACHRFVVGEPGNPELRAHRLDPWRPVIRFNVMAMLMEGPSGRLEQQPGDLVQMWVPRGAGYGRPGDAEAHAAVYRPGSTGEPERRAARPGGLRR